MSTSMLIPIPEQLERQFQTEVGRGTPEYKALLDIEGAFHKAVRPDAAAQGFTTIPTPAEYGQVMHWLDARLEEIGYPQFMAHPHLQSEREKNWFSICSQEQFEGFMTKYQGLRKEIWTAILRAPKV